ncbi:MAG: hypothetical protein CM15mP21_4200 [Hyphomicrobiales bacterium]|nr:MAG: hypothetical protein CM15mP21_4200 [Hyphomicrobiales bacterium]
MTEVLFYHLERQTLEQVLPRLVQASLGRDWRVVVKPDRPSAYKLSIRIYGHGRMMFSCRMRPRVMRVLLNLPPTNLSG